MDFDLTASSLEVLTNKNVGSTGLLNVDFLSAKTDGSPMGGIQIDFATKKLKLKGCDTEMVDFTDVGKVDSKTNLNVWRFSSTMKQS